MDDDLTRFTDGGGRSWRIKVRPWPSGTELIIEKGNDFSIAIDADSAPRLVAAILTAYNRAKAERPGGKGGPG